jgi:hypothetical protein
MTNPDRFTTHQSSCLQMGQIILREPRSIVDQTFDSVIALSATRVPVDQGHPSKRFTQPHAQHAKAETSVHANRSNKQLGPMLSGDYEQTIHIAKEKKQRLFLSSCLHLLIRSLISPCGHQIEKGLGHLQSRSQATTASRDFRMLASIVLDQSFPHYTNLDYISGKVFVRTQTATTVSAIVVKLEGESRTRLLVHKTHTAGRLSTAESFLTVDLCSLLRTQAMIGRNLSWSFTRLVQSFFPCPIA